MIRAEIVASRSLASCTSAVMIPRRSLSLRGIRAQFTEGLDTRDLRDADDFLRSFAS